MDDDVLNTLLRLLGQLKIEAEVGPADRTATPFRFHLPDAKIRRWETLHNNFNYETTFDKQTLFPEDILDDLLYSRQVDLPSLESLLAESIDIIILIPKSPGSFAELGAFANVEKL